jgi:hypothetical protein
MSELPNCGCPNCLAEHRIKCKAALAKANERIKDLEASLELYGTHADDCDYPSVKCTCGLRKALSEVQK